MKRSWMIGTLIAMGSMEASVSLDNLIEGDKTEYLRKLEKTTDTELWDVFLKGQARLFFPYEFKWISGKDWWSKAKNILEIGSGNGAYLYKLAELFRDKEFKGIEKLSDSVKLAREQCSSDNLTFQEGDAEVFDDQLAYSADIVLFRLTLQHLKDPNAALKNAYRYLSAGGYVWIVDSCDVAKRTSHPVPAIEDALKLVAEEQKKKGKGNRKVTLELLQALEDNASPFADLYEVAYSNLNRHGELVEEVLRFEGSCDRILYFNHSILFLNLIHRKFGVSVDLSGIYDQMHEYLADEGAWTSPGIHLLVLKKKAG